ncbi:MAG: P-loop NTPase fold protein [Xanthomonadales bacterium]|nr:P-loop NTPase fold protein [Xanthomonadales bacterium]
MDKTQDIIPRYWIFQAMPDRFDLEEKLRPGASDSWLLSHSYQEIDPGDVVYFWRGGRQAGLFGWGVVTDPPYLGETEPSAKKPRWRVNTRYEVRFETLIPKDEITSGRHGAQLAGLVILRTPQGTNFKVTTYEAIHLNRLITERSESAPPDPVGADSSRFPMKSIDSLNFGHSVSTIIGAGLIYYSELGSKDRDGLDGEVIVEALLTMALTRQGPSRGTIPFLAKIFSGMEVNEKYIIPLEEPVHPLQDAKGYFLLVEALYILEAARLFAIYSTRKEEIGVRHLVAGILTACRERTLAQIERHTESVGISLRDFVQQFVDHTVAEFSNDDSSAWLSQFRAGANVRLDSFETRQAEKTVETRAKKATAESPKTADVTPAVEEKHEQEAEAEKDDVSSAIQIAFAGRPAPDRPFGADLLRIDSEVAALAHLFALRDVAESETGENERSTFALGLFGRWGSGKSFFIEKLKAKIEKLRGKQSDTRPQYCQEIIQIDFNAWHYNEANIWASLVHHIFDSLQRHFEKESKEKEFKRLISELEISQERREKLNSQITAKVTQRDDIETKIRGQEAKIDTLIDDQLTRISALPERLAANEAARKQLIGLLPEVAKILNFPAEKMKKQLAEGEKTASDIINIVNEGSAALGQSRLIGRTILRSGLTMTFIAFAGLALVIYFSLPALLDNDQLWDEFLPIPGQIVALVTPALIWFRKRLTDATNLLNEVGSIEAKLREDMRKEAEDKDKSLETLRAEQKRVSDEIIDANEKKDLLDQEILDLQSKLDDLGSAESLVDYINDRASSDDYRSELGILALIRRDFEKLFRLMTDRNELSLSSKNKPESEAELPRINRIILYIDDLDRVQDSKKVLQVLEAVHLLLAFPLFHVVVAVDERWAARSVLSHHADFFGIKKVANDVNNSQALHERASLLELIGSQPATPREFLEKIFQISFWVRPLTEQLTEGLIDGTVKKSYQAAPAVTSEVETGRADDEEASSADEAVQVTTESEAVNQQENVEGNVTTIEDPQPDATADEVKDASAGIVESRSEPEHTNAAFDGNFEITNEELISMRALGPVVGRSPRTVKRFINTYRLFKAMKIPPGEGGWTENDIEEYDLLEYHVPIMILLSIQVGYPDIAVRFFEHIDSALSDSDVHEFGILLDEWSNSPPEKEIEKEKWTKAINALQSVHDLYGEKSHLADIDIEAFNPWLLATSRFGFQEWVPK